MDDEQKPAEAATDEGRGGPVEESTTTVDIPRADGDGDEAIRQQPVGHGQVLGHGEFPGDQPPRGPEEVEEG